MDFKSLQWERQICASAIDSVCTLQSTGTESSQACHTAKWIAFQLQCVERIKTPLCVLCLICVRIWLSAQLNSLTHKGFNDRMSHLLIVFTYIYIYVYKAFSEGYTEAHTSIAKLHSPSASHIAVFVYTKITPTRTAGSTSLSLKS